MEVTVDCWKWAESESKPDKVAVGLTKGTVDLHSGVLYLVEGKARVLHLAWHCLLQDEALPDPDGDWFGVSCQIDPLFIPTLLRRCQHLAQKSAGTAIPYSLQYLHSKIDENGGYLSSGGEKGLGCATFVLALFELSGVVLIDLNSWNQRDAARQQEDTEAQTKLVALLRRHGYSDQAEAITPEIGCLRFRAEEVAAASGMKNHPVAYDKAMPEGKALHQRLKLTPNS